MSADVRRTYTLTAERYADLLAACRPVLYMVMGGMATSGPQENANRAWQQLGRDMGFDWTTVQAGQTPTQFSAVPIDRSAS